MCSMAYKYTCPNCNDKFIAKDTKRTRFYYNIDCKCCDGCKHTEQVVHCKECRPIRPTDAIITKKLERTGNLPDKLFK